MCVKLCADPEVVRRGPAVTTYYFICFYFKMRRERIGSKYTTNSGPPMARQHNTISMAFRWRADDGPTLSAGLAAL